MKSDDPDHVFIIDADDWVSLDVVDFVSKEARTRGGSDFWYVDKGYLVNIQDKKLVRKHGLCRYCGTSFIYDYRKLMLLVLANNPAPSSISEEAILKALGEFIVVSFLGNHRYQFGHLAKFGCKPAPIPFYSICWILNTGENHSGQTGGSSGLPITAGMLDQFGQNHTLASSERASVRSRVTELLDMMKSKVGWMLTDKRAERV
ncbi:hypothetical protein N9052_00565 [bacterium]|nr:hypothetical protein [Congregibacter sp.]MDA8962011.1 hypothetical protein [Congregibacter sp.]MDB4476053.1 hypothetical protein [bacterium]